MIKKGFLLALFAIGVFANIFAQDTLSFKKTRDKNIYIEFLGASNLIGVSFDSRFTPISPWGYRIGISYFQGGDSFIKASNSNRGLFFVHVTMNFLLKMYKSYRLLNQKKIQKFLVLKIQKSSYQQ